MSGFTQRFTTLNFHSYSPTPSRYMNRAICTEHWHTNTIHESRWTASRMTAKSALLKVPWWMRTLFFTAQGWVELKLVFSVLHLPSLSSLAFRIYIYDDDMIVKSNAWNWIFPARYRYHFPFLDLDGLTVDDNRVGPLYKHVFPPMYAPNLSFVGLPVKVQQRFFNEIWNPYYDKSEIFLHGYWLQLHCSDFRSWSRKPKLLRIQNSVRAFPDHRLPGAGAGSQVGRGRAVGAGDAAKRGGHDGVREEPLPANGGGREAEAPHARTGSSVGKPTLTTCDCVCVCVCYRPDAAAWNCVRSDQAEHMNWLADQVGEPPVEPWKCEMFDKVLASILALDEAYRDRWEQEEDAGSGGHQEGIRIRASSIM